VACPADDDGDNNGSNASFTPALGLYDGCPAGGSALLLASSADTSVAARQAANASLRAMFDAPSPLPSASPAPTQVPTPTVDQPSALPTAANVTRAAAASASGVGFVLRRTCAVLTFDATPAWLQSLNNDDVSNDDVSSFGARGVWLAVDSNLGGGTSDAAFHLALTCSARVPTPQPSPAPTATPRPSAAPTSVPARSNCVCMSAGMVAGIAEHCPVLSQRFVEGCMRNVTRADLEEYAG
jgi:hypothetical protein